MSFIKRRKFHFDDMDEIEQMKLFDELGINDMKKGITDLNSRLAKLEKRLSWQDNIITANVAAAQVEQAEQDALPEELDKAFSAIKNAIQNGWYQAILNEYERRFDSSYPICRMVRQYHPQSLAKALRKYGYGVQLKDGDDEYGMTIIVSWKDKKATNEKLEPCIELDPNKRYSLPLEDTRTADHGYYYAVRNGDSWAIAVSGGPSMVDDLGFTVSAGDLIDAPAWVKAIKPIEVKA